MVQWVVGSILHGGPIKPFLNDWCNKGRGMCYPVCEVVHINDPLLLIGKNSKYTGAAGFLSRNLNGPLPYI